MSFRDIIGHDRQVEVLKGNIRTGQLPPAYLFHGDEGVGKLMTAVELAKAVNCTAPDIDGSACGVCQSCKNIASGCHPNVRIVALDVNPDTGKMRQEIVIGQVRSAQDFLSLRGVGEGRKVLIVDGAHQMNEEAMNAFLKTLEEPPDNSHVVLVTPKPNRLLVTILSRSRAVGFQPLKEEDVAGILMGKRGLPEKDALLIARMTGGRVGEALSADAADISERRAAFLKILGEIAAKPPSAVLRHAEAVAKEDSGLEDFASFGTLWFRDLLVILVGGGEELAYNRDMTDELGRWTAGMTPYRCEEALTLLRETGRALERTFNRRLVAEDLFFRLREEVLG